MKQVYYRHISREDYYKLKDSLRVFDPTHKLKDIVTTLDTLREKLKADKYLLIYYDLVFNPSFNRTEIKVTRIGIWNNHPANYGSISYDEDNDCYSDNSYEFRPQFLPNWGLCSEESDTHKLFIFINSILNLITYNENRLQKQEDSGQRPESGCILYGGGDGSQLTTGRHCDQARIEEIGERFKGSEIVISSRRTEILRA